MPKCAVSQEEIERLRSLTCDAMMHYYETFDEFPTHLHVNLGSMAEEVVKAALENVGSSEFLFGLVVSFRDFIFGKSDLFVGERDYDFNMRRCAVLTYREYGSENTSDG